MRQVALPHSPEKTEQNRRSPEPLARGFWLIVRWQGCQRKKELTTICTHCKLTP